VHKLKRLKGECKLREVSRPEKTQGGVQNLKSLKGERREKKRERERRERGGSEVPDLWE
jgi:hypothetical protein